MRSSISFIFAAVILYAKDEWARKFGGLAQECGLKLSNLPLGVPVDSFVRKKRKASLSIHFISLEKSSIEVTNGSIRMVFSKNTGYLSSYQLNGYEIIEKALKPNFWRAPTDNDFASGMPLRQSYWKEVVDKLSLKNFSFNEHNSEVVSVHEDEDDSIQITTKYKIDGGKLKVDYQLTTISNLPNIPRVGLQVKLDEELDQLKWFGRGPLETYADKKTGSFFGLYTESVKDDYTYYVRPQESSNKAEVWWAELTNSEGNGIRIEAEQDPLSISAWPFTLENIEEAKRIEELEFSNITLNIDYKQMGVGGDNTWNRDAGPHVPFRIPAKSYRYTFWIKPVMK
ncbi:beta-galactosidase small subunit [Ekhidna sp.]